MYIVVNTLSEKPQRSSALILLLRRFMAELLLNLLTDN